jgi:hypothetical protein
MADPSPELLEYLRRLSEGTSNLSGKILAASEAYKTGALSQTQYFDSIKKTSKELKDRTNPGFMTFANNLVKGNKQFQSMQEELKALNKAIEEAADVSTKARLTDERDALARKENNNRIKYETAQYSMDMGKVMVDGATKAIGGLARGLQADASSTALTSGLMNAGIDIAEGAAKATGSMMSASGQAMQAGAGFAKSAKVKAGLLAVGMGLDFLGNATSKTAESMAKLARFGVEILSAEVEKTVKAFETMSASGAIFADGMQGMRDASAGAGLTVDQFSRVVQANSRALGDSGVGVAEGAAAMGRVGKIFDQNGGKVRTELRNLGYGLEEQAALTAQTMANMRRSAGGKSTDAAVAEQTQKYAENLRTIAQITGEDAAAKVKQAAEQNQILAFQQYLAGKTPEQRAQIDAAMATMTDQEKKNLRDRAVFNGQVINQEGAIYESMNAAAAAKGQAVFAQLERNELTAKTSADLNAQYGEAIRDAFLAQREFGVAAMSAGGQLADVGKGMLDAINQANKYTTDAVGATAEALAKVKNTTDPLTTNMQAAADAAQALKLAMQALMDVPIKDFATVSRAMLESVQTMLVDLNLAKPGAAGSGQSAAEQQSWWAKNGRQTIESTMGIIGMVGGGALGGLAGGGVGSVVTGAAGAYGGEKAGEYIGSWIANMLGLKPGPGKATGGIATGPDSGYLEKLHGTEAVIPTVGGKVPIDIRTSVGDSRMPSFDVVADAIRQSMLAVKSFQGDEAVRVGGSLSDTYAKTNYAEEKMMQQRTEEFQSMMITMMQKFIESQQDMTSRMEEQIRQTEKLVSAAS